RELSPLRNHPTRRRGADRGTRWIQERTTEPASMPTPKAAATAPKPKALRPRTSRARKTSATLSTATKATTRNVPSINDRIEGCLQANRSPASPSERTPALDLAATRKVFGSPVSSAAEIAK